MRRYIFLVALLLGLALSARAQPPELINDSDFRTDATAAIDSIYNFNFDGADARLAPWKNQYPDHPLWMVLDGIEFWWKVLSDLEDTSHDEQFVNIMKRVDYQAGKLLHNQPSHADGLIVRAISNGYLARHNANRGNWLTSMNFARKALNAYNYLRDQQPDLPDLKLAEGLKLYYTAYLPEEYPIVKTVSWAMPSGNKEKGLVFIREASEEAIFARAEAAYFLGNINYNYENDYEVAVRQFETLQNQYPNNNYYARVLAKSYYKRGKHDEALNFIQQTLQRWKEDNLPHFKVMQEELLAWKGRILEQREDDQAALEAYQKSFEVSQQLPRTKERSFYVVSGYLAGDLLYEQNKPDEAKYYLKKVSEADVDNGYRERARELLATIEE